MGNSESTSPWAAEYETIKQNHDSAYSCIDSAISLEEQEKPAEALAQYKQGMVFIHQALNTQVTCPENPDFTWERACVMIQKMKKTRAEVLHRINVLNRQNDFAEDPPTYEEAIASGSKLPKTYSELAAALSDMKVQQTNSEVDTKVIYVHDDVRLYFISPDGSVTQTLEAETLTIALLSGNDAGANSPTAVLQIGDWIYPLVPGVSPCYRTEYGAFILPDVHSDEPGSSVGIILPPSADSSVYELLESILHGIVSQEPSLHRTRRDTSVLSSKLSSGLVTGGYYISQGLIKGAEKASQLLNYGTPRLIDNMAPAEQPTPISQKVTKGMQIAQNATMTAAQATGFVASKIGYATQALGRFLAPHVQTQGTKLLSSGFNYSEEEASDKMNGLLTVAAGAVEGFVTVYDGLEQSASILGQSLSNNTVKVVEHKYGGPAGELASGTFNTVGNVMSIRSNAKVFTAKGLAKRTVKATGTAVVEDFRTRHHRNGTPAAAEVPTRL